MRHLLNQPKVIITALIILLIIGTWTFIRSRPQTAQGVAKEQLQVALAKDKVDINREFQFPISDSQGKEVTKIKFFIQNAEKQDEIIVAGQKATSVKGKTFLIINLKITNDYNKTITLNTRDYIRLVLNNNEAEQIAPEIHNDPIEILAISTKYTRIGFTINDSDANLKLKVGEINKDKTSLTLPFSK